MPFRSSPYSVFASSQRSTMFSSRNRALPLVCFTLFFLTITSVSFADAASSSTASAHAASAPKNLFKEYMSRGLLQCTSQYVHTLSKLHALIKVSIFLKTGERLRNVIRCLRFDDSIPLISVFSSSIFQLSRVLHPHKPHKHGLISVLSGSLRRIHRMRTTDERSFRKEAD